MAGAREIQYPHHVLIGDRPVQVIQMPDGAIDVLAFDWETGEMVRELKYHWEATGPTDRWDVEWISAAEFEACVAKLRSELKSRRESSS